MARANVPHVISDDSALGGNLIGGSLRFNKSNNSYLSRTFSGSSYDKQKKWTWSAWVKFGTVHQGVLFSGSPTCGGSRTCLYYENARLITDVCGVGAYDQSIGLYRDSNAWYHIVWRFDTTNATAADRSRIYVNGTEIPVTHPRTWSQNVGYGIGKNELHTMGVFTNSLTAGALDAQMAEVNFISELSLDASYFGYTDSQTGTWRPKKYTGAYNTTGFYLPLNGSQHIGKDMSGNGCDWEPVKLSGTVPIGKATGAFPILKTNNGATVIHPGVRPDSFASNIVFASSISESGIVASDVHHLIKGSGSAKSVTNSSVSNSITGRNFYGRSGSGYFNGSGAKLTVASSSDFALGTGDFTIELWFNKTTTNASEYLFDFGTNQLSMYFLSNNTLYYYANVGGSNTGNVEIGTVGVNEWNHVAAVRTSGVIKLYLNGQHIHTQNEPRNWSSAQTVTIGQYGGGGNYSFEGYIQDFRIYKGVAKYTDTFTCGAVDSSVIEDTPSGIAIPRTLDSHTGGSVALHTTANVSPDIIVASNNDLYLDGDFTIEFWIYLNSINNDTQHPSIITFPDNSGLGQVYINSSYNFYSLYWPSSDIVKTVDNGAQIGKWQYVTITRSSNSCRIFVDGVLGGSGYSGSHATATSSQAFGNSYGGLRIGGYTQNGGNVDGHISNLRIIKGTALYTSNFTPPTEPLTNVTGTSLLCFQSPTDVEAFTVDKNASTLNNKNWTRSGSFAWSIGADSNVNQKHRQFDGTIETGSAGAPNGNPGNVRFTFDSPITGITKCRIRANTHNDTYQYRRTYYNGANGTYSIQTGSNTTAWHDVTSNVGNTLNWVEWGSYGGADSDRGPYGCNGIEINDVLLTDRFRDNDGHGDKSSASHFSPFDNDIIQEGISQYAVLNANAHSGVTLSNGALTNTGGNDIPSNMGVKTGKFYAEVRIQTSYGSPNLKHIGICATGNKSFRAINNDSHIISGLDALMIRSDASGPYSYTGQSNAITSWTQVFNDTNIIFTNGDIVGMQLDMDNKFVKFYINGSLRTHYTFVTNSNFHKMYFFGRNNGSGKTTWNFGQKPYQYTPPSGFLPLASHNLESSSILKSQRIFDTVLWTGNGGTSQTVTGLQFKPDFVWLKGRNSAWHRLQNSVTGANKLLYSNATNAEATNEANGHVSEFTADGFKLADPDGNGGGVNSNGDGYVAWCWKAGGDSNTFNVDDVGYASAAAAGLDSGTLAITGASVGTKQGFSIITYAGTDSGSSQTIPHGLNQPPELYIFKNRTSASSWIVYTTAIDGGSDYLTLNAANSSNSGVSPWSTLPTSSVITVGTNNSDTCNAGDNYVLYAWHSVPGFSRIGSYVGNGNDNGPYVDCGFRPAFILTKNVNSSSFWWEIVDNKRVPYNPTNKTLYANVNDAEYTNTVYNKDLYANGFKIRGTNGSVNTNGSRYIFMAFAEQPEVTSFGSQSNAR